MNSIGNTVPYTHWRTILFGETDAAAIVYTTRFTDYCMEAAEFWFKKYIEIDWYKINLEQKMGTPVVHMELDFSASLIAGDQLAVVVRVAKIGRATVTLEFEGLRKRDAVDTLTQCFTAKFVHCFYSNETAASIPIPNQQRVLLDRYITMQDQ